MHNPRLTLFWIFACFGILFIPSCAPSARETATGSGEETDVLHRYERSFNPSDYDVNQALLEPSGPVENASEPEPTKPPILTTNELIPGFRVQVGFSEDIEIANQIKNDLTSRLPDGNVYLVFETPYYKIRVGDFETRSIANSTVRMLMEIGYRDAWVVPDRVHTSPPPKQPVPPSTGEPRR